MNCAGYPKMKYYKCMNLSPSTIPWSEILLNDSTLPFSDCSFKGASLKLFNLRSLHTLLITENLKELLFR